MLKLESFHASIEVGWSADVTENAGRFIAMKIVIFGLSLSSSWGNGHATNWRSLLSALSRRRHRAVFFEQDTPYYSANRDLAEPSYADLCIYDSFEMIASYAKQHCDDADVAIVTSYCPDAIQACSLVLSSRASVRAFYDLDTPITLQSISDGNPLFYVRPEGLADFDLVMSFTGGRALDELKAATGAVKVLPMYGSVDPAQYYPTLAVDRYRADLSYIGTYAPDRQAALQALFLEPARQRPQQRFFIGGSLYPRKFPWLDNIYYNSHLCPSEHSVFYSSSRMTLNITRSAMAQMGYCPSGRLFEASACGVPIVSDEWPGIGSFFMPGEEITLVKTSDDVLAALEQTDRELQDKARRARERTLAKHTGDVRAIEFESAIASVW